MAASCISVKKQYVLSIDLGTSGPKVALVGQDGEIAATGYARLETLFLPDGGAEQDGEAIWDAVKSVCRQVLAEAGRPAEDVVGLFCSSQYSSVIPVDRAGRPVMNMVLWMDTRGAPRRLAERYPAARGFASAWQKLTWLRLHGLPPLDSGVESLAHMRWIKFACPDVYDRTHAFLEPMDYVTMRFTGQATANQCSAFMMMTIDNRRLNVTEYCESLVAYSGIDREKLPDLVPLDAIIGTVRPEVADEIGLSPETRVVSGFNDTQSGGMASHAFKGDHAGLSIGTTTVLLTHMRAKRTSVKYNILSNPSPVPGTYFLMAENGLGGKAVEHVLERLVLADDAFGSHASADRFETLGRATASVEPGSDGVLFLPWLAGAMAPKDDPGMRGGFLNMSLETTRAHLARAALEGVAMNLRWLQGGVERFIGRHLSHIVFYGGGALSDGWSQILADVLDLPIHQLADCRYANCLGGALLAFERLGMLSLDDFEGLVRVKQVFEPAPAHRARYDELFQQFVAAYRANRPICHALNGRAP